MTKNIVLLGAPASGKGTQRKLLLQAFDEKDIAVYASGDMITREAKQPNSRWQALCQHTLETGAFIPDEAMLDIYRKHRRRAPIGLYDGLPRTLGQALALRKELRGRIAIYFHVPRSVSEQRMIDRGRDYDLDPQRRAARLKDHEQQVVPMAREHFSDAILVDGTLPPEVVLHGYLPSVRAYLNGNGGRR